MANSSKEGGCAFEEYAWFGFNMPGSAQHVHHFRGHLLETRMDVGGDRWGAQQASHRKSVGFIHARANGCCELGITQLGRHWRQLTRNFWIHKNKKKLWTLTLQWALAENYLNICLQDEITLQEVFGWQRRRHALHKLSLMTKFRVNMYSKLLYQFLHCLLHAHQ